VTLRRPILLLVLAALLPLVILSATLGAAWLRVEQKTLETEAWSRVNEVSTLIDRELASTSALVRVLAQTPFLDSPINAAGFRELAARFRREQPLWLAIRVGDAQGRVMVEVPEGTPNEHTVDMESHARAVNERRVVIGPVMRGAGGRLAFTVRAPVIREDVVQSVVTAAIEPTAIQQLLLMHEFPAGWIGAVVDADGRLVARNAGAERFVGEPAMELAREAVSRGGSGTYSTASLDGRDVLTAYRVLPSGWSVHVAIPGDVYRAPFVRSAWLVGSAAALSLTLVAIFLWLLQRELRLRRREEGGIEAARRMEALGRMTGGIAHDFNNLLQILHGGAELLKRRRFDPDKVSALSDGLLSAAQRGRALTRQLLAFAGRSSHRPIAFDLRHRMPDLLALLKRSTREDIKTTLSAADDTWPISADPDALEVAMINLAVNARDAMPEGGRLTITATNVTLKPGSDSHSLAGDYVALAVSDSGTGIPEEHLGHVFEPFYTTKPPGEGTGLGLSQVYGFARQSGGAVTIATKMGQGTTVTLYLPRARDPVVPLVVPDAPQAAGEEGRVLLVEDNADVGQVTEAMLSSVGYVVTRANSGPEALHLLDRPSAEFDVVLTDIVMDGGMSGLDLASRIRDRRPELPIVLMTGYSDALRKSTQLGLPVLSKPFRLNDAVAALRGARRDSVAEKELSA